MVGIYIVRELWCSQNILQGSYRIELSVVRIGHMSSSFALGLLSYLVLRVMLKCQTSLLAARVQMRPLLGSRGEALFSWSCGGRSLECGIEEFIYLVSLYI